MPALDVRKEGFVATAVAIALVVDGARLPVYAFSVGTRLAEIRLPLAIAVIAVTAGTLLGKRILGWVPERLE